MASDNPLLNTISNFGKLFQPGLTEKECEQMLVAWEPWMSSILKLKEEHGLLDHFLDYPLVFTPKADKSNRSLPESTPFNFFHSSQTHTDPSFMDLAELRHILDIKQYSTTELAQHFLSRLSKHGKSLMCTVELCKDTALEKARNLDFKSDNPLNGFPYGLKDLFAVKGQALSCGIKPFLNNNLNFDSTVYSRLNQSPMLARLSLGELAANDVWFEGQTRNPWNTDLGSGGSSAGSCAAVSAGLVPFAIGTETAGSIVNPAANCGVTGFRPSFGRISRHGAMPLSWSLDKVGIVCRRARDAGLVFSQIMGADDKDLSVQNHPFAWPWKQPVTELKKLRLGYFDLPGQDQSCLKTSLEVISPAIQEVIELTPPKLDPDDLITIILTEAAAVFEDLITNNLDDHLVEQGDQSWPNRLRMAQSIPAVEYIRAQRLRTLLMQDWNRLFEQVDAIIHPTRHWKTIFQSNLGGYPAIALPAGLDEKGLPLSITICGPLYREDIALSLGEFFQEQTEHHRLQAPDYSD